MVYPLAMAQRKAPTPEIDPEKLRALLKERDWTITRLAQEMGISQPFAHQVVQGAEKPGRKFILGLLSIGVDIRTLLRDDATPPAPDTAAI